MHSSAASTFQSHWQRVRLPAVPLTFASHPTAHQADIVPLLILSLSSITTSLKLCQWAPLVPKQQLSSLRKVNSTSMPGAAQTIPLSKKNKTEVVIPVTKPCSNRLSPSSSTSVTAFNWDYRENHNLCLRLPYQTFQGPEVLFHHPRIHHPLHGKSVISSSLRTTPD